ncbi:MAG TPA: phosphoglycerate mutase family protein [Thermoanaerobaculia bacterium]|jgi:broad specificity phosphatase PhoE|nr:phosphoglycerate mutase family protein [Thermoanaerobaculia bacterium]
MRKFALVLLLFSALPLFASETVIFAVRHAEKATDGSADPALTAEGVARAASLARILRDAGVTVVYSTPTTRTRTTARPLGIPVTEDASAPEALARRILRENRGKNVLVVGHSNTVPLLLKALGVSSPPAIGDNDFDNLFVAVVPEKGATRLIRLHY